MPPRYDATEVTVCQISRFHFPSMQRVSLSEHKCLALLFLDILCPCLTPSTCLAIKVIQHVKTVMAIYFQKMEWHCAREKLTRLKHTSQYMYFFKGSPILHPKCIGSYVLAQNFEPRAKHTIQHMYFLKSHPFFMHNLWCSIL